MAHKVVKEITAGFSASLSMDASSGGGGAGLRIQRVWKIIFENASDMTTADVPAIIGVSIGSRHPSASIAVCDNISVQPDGDSRHSFIATATYTSQPLSLTQGSMSDQNPDPRTQSPEARKANWSTSTTTIESPSWIWKPAGQGNWVPATNPAGDLYESLTTLQPVVDIQVEQLQLRDPNEWSINVGQVNSNAFKIGALNCGIRQVMLRGVTATPHVEIVGKQYFRGWKATYSFLFKPGYNNYLGQYIGWDVAIPVEGFNIINVAGAQANPNVERGALALKLSDGIGTIDGWEQQSVIEPTLVNKKSRANVLIAAPNAKAMQRPSAQPVALNLDGTPRNTALKPLVQVAQIYRDFNMSLLNLKLD